MISEERLRQAANEAGKALADSLPDPEDCHHTFSPEFERNMARLLRKSRYMGLKQGLQRAACFFLVLLCSGGVWLSVDAEAREAFFGWLRTRVGDAQRYFYEGDTSELPEMPSYMIQVPEEYLLISRIETDGMVDEFYQNDAGDYISFSYQYEGEIASSELYVVDTDTQYMSVAVRGVDADIYLPDDENDSTTIVWSNTEMGVLFQVTAYLCQEELIELAETVVPEKTETF